MKLILCLSLGLLALPPVHGMDQSCGNTQCGWNAVCSSSGTCTCDTSRGFVPSSRVDGYCLCPANHHPRSSDLKCAKNLGQACSANSECGDHSVCDTTCKCDESKNFVKQLTSVISCWCNSSKAMDLDPMNPGQCQLKAGQPCTATSDCVPTRGMICSSGTCGCDTSKNFRASRPGDHLCTCADNYGKIHDGSCGKLEGQSCTADDTCVDHATCTSGTCTCDASSSPSSSIIRRGQCECTAATHALKWDNTCGLRIGQTCSADSQCIDNATCVDGKCKCDATLNRDVTTPNGYSYCRCDANSVEFNAVCYKKVGQPCNDVSECIRTPGMVCQDVSGTKKCTCNTNDNFAAGRDGDTSCFCAANYSFSSEDDGICALKLGKACNANSAPCIHGAVCDDKTSTCVCDTANNYKTAALGDTSCHCADNAFRTNIKGKTYCGNKAGSTCDAKTGGIACTTNAESTETTAQNDKSSNSEGGLLVSLAVLVTGLVMTLIPV